MTGDTDNSTSTEAQDLIRDLLSPAPLLPDAEILAKVKATARLVKARRAEARELSRAAAVREAIAHGPAIVGPESDYCFSVARMQVRGDELGVKQDISKVRPTRQRIQDFVDWFLKSRKLGTKFGAPCYYGAHFFVEKDATRENCAFVQKFTIDLDAKFCPRKRQMVAAIRSRAELNKVRALLRSKGMHLYYTSSSHDPESGKWCCKFILWCALAMTYEEAALVGKELRREIADCLGVVEEPIVKGEWHRWDCVDPVCERPVQVQLVPQWKNARIRAQAEAQFEHEGLGVWDPSETYLARARVRLKEIEARARKGSTAAQAMRRDWSASTGLPSTGSLVDTQAEVARALDKLGPIIPGCGGSDNALWQAARALRNWGIDEDEAVQEMESRYPGHTPGRVARKVRDAYKAHGLIGCWLRRAEERAGAGTDLESYFDIGGGTAEFDLGATPETPLPDLLASERPQDGDSPGAAPFAAPGASVGGPSTGSLVESSGSTERPVDNADAPPKRTPQTTTIVHEQYLAALPSFAALRKLEVIKAHPGTGKNERLLPAWKALEGTPGSRGLCVTYRRALTRGNTNRWSFGGSIRRNYQDILGPIEERAFDICVNSIGNIVYQPTLDDNDESIDVTVWDEWCQLLRHVFSTGSEAELCELWAAMETLFRRSKCNMIQDAHMSILGVHAAHLLLGWDTPDDADEHLLINTWKGEPRPILKWECEEAFHRTLMASVADTTRHNWLQTSSATHAEAVYREACSILPKELVLLITADTIRDDAPGVRDAIENPALFSNYLFVIGSPAIWTGLSVAHKQLWHLWVHLRGAVGQEQVHTAEDAHQAMCRTRDPIETNVWADARASFAETSAEAILEDLQIKAVEHKANKFIVGQYKEIVGGGVTELVYAEGNQTLLTVKADIMAHEARTGGQLGDRYVKDKQGNVLEVVPGTLWAFLEKKCNCKIIRAAGDSVTPVEKKEIRESIVENKEFAAADHRAAVLAADDIPLKMAESLAKCPNPPPGTGAAIEKAFAVAFYGKPLTDELLKRDNRGKARGKIRMAMFVRAIMDFPKLGRERVAEQDALAIKRSGVSLSAKAYGPAKRIAALFAAFEITDLWENARQGKVIKVPDKLPLPAETRKDLHRWLKIKITAANMQAPAKLLSSVLAKIGMNLDSKRITNPDGSRSREYRLRQEDVELIYEDGEAFFTRLLVPKERPGSEPNWNDILAGIHADEGPFPTPMARAA